MMMEIITLAHALEAKCKQLEDAERRIDLAVGFQRALEAERDALLERVRELEGK
jgi:hypothetical protein